MMEGAVLCLKCSVVGNSYASTQYGLLAIGDVQGRFLRFMKDSLWWHWETNSGENLYKPQWGENIIAWWYAAFSGLGPWGRGLLTRLGIEYLLFSGTCSGVRQLALGGHSSSLWTQRFWPHSFYKIEIMNPVGYGESRCYLFVLLVYSEVQRWDSSLWMCLTPGIRSSEWATCIKALEAIMNLMLHRWYIKSPGSLFSFFHFLVKLTHKFDDSEPITCNFLKYWSYV